jgi:hypothetical protein
MKHSWWIWCVVGVLIGAALIRFVGLGQVPNGLYIDEIAMLADAKSIALSGKDIHGNPALQAIFFSYGDYKLPLYIWCVAIAVKVFGVSAFALRFPSALAGVLSTGLVGAMVFQVLYRKPGSGEKLSSCWAPWYGAVIAMVVMATSPWSVLFSRTGFEGHLGQLCLSFSLFALIKRWVYRGHWCWLVAAGVAGALSVYSYFSSLSVWPLLALGLWCVAGGTHLWPVVIKLLEGRSLHHWGVTLRKVITQHGTQSAHFIGEVVVVGVVFALGVLPLLLSSSFPEMRRVRLSAESILMKDHALESNVLREQSGNDIVSRLFFHRHVLLFRELVANYADFFSLRYLFLSGDQNLRHGTQRHGVFVLPLLVPFVLVWSSYAKRKCC